MEEMFTSFSKIEKKEPVSPNPVQNNAESVVQNRPQSDVVTSQNRPIQRSSETVPTAYAQGNVSYRPVNNVQQYPNYGYNANVNRIQPIPQPPKRTIENYNFFDMTKKDTVYAILLFISSAIFSIFGLYGGYRAGFAAYALLSFVLITTYLCSKQTKIRVFPLISGFLSCATAIPFVITSNDTIRFWSVVIMTLLSAVWFDSLVNSKPADDFGLIKRIFGSFLDGLAVNMPRTVASLFYSKTKRKKWLGYALLGMFAALPVLFIVVPLLMSSDAAFSGVIEKISEDLMYTIYKIVIGFMIAPFIVAYCFSLKKEKKNESEPSEFGGIENAIVIAFLSVISLCYVLYLVSQLAYFFSAFNGFLPDDYSFTVADYARRGFFEMTIIAAINFILIFVALLVSKKKNKKICTASRILCVFISMFTLIIIATALSKMMLYIESFGMTRLRIMTSSFMVFLAIVFVALMFRLFIPKVKIFNTALVTAGIILVLLGGFNVNKVVAMYNYEAYKNGKLTSMDVYTISELGDEGIPYLVKLAGDENNAIATEAKNLLEVAIQYDYYNFDYEDGKYVIGEKIYDDIGEFSVARHEAYEALDSYIKVHPEVCSYDAEWWMDDDYYDDYYDDY